MNKTEIETRQQAAQLYELINHCKPGTIQDTILGFLLSRQRDEERWRTQLIAEWRAQADRQSYSESYDQAVRRTLEGCAEEIETALAHGATLEKKA